MQDIQLINFPADVQVPVDPSTNDFSFVNNDLATVSGPARRQQDVTKGLLTELGSNPIQPTYGSELPDITASRDLPSVTGEITDSVQLLLSFFDANDDSNDADEKLSAIAQLAVQQNPSDSRQYYVLLSILLASGQTVTSNIPA